MSWFWERWKMLEDVGLKKTSCWLLTKQLGFSRLSGQSLAEESSDD